MSHGRFLCFIVKFLVKADTMNREPVLRFYDPLSITLKKNASCLLISRELFSLANHIGMRHWDSAYCHLKTYRTPLRSAARQCLMRPQCGPLFRMCERPWVTHQCVGAADMSFYNWLIKAWLLGYPCLFLFFIYKLTLALNDSYRDHFTRNDLALKSVLLH